MTPEGRILRRLAHAFTPVAWTGPGLVAAIVVFGLVGAIIVVQRALIADDAIGWAITAVHAIVVAVVVPVLSRRAVRDWRAARADGTQPSIGVPE